MPNFKPKANRDFKVSKKYSVTLDNKHDEKMNEFFKIENERIPAFKKQKKEIKKQIKNAKNIEEKLDLVDKLNELRKTIRRLQNEKKKYLLNNSHFIFDYFEKKKEISEGNNKKKKFYILFLTKMKLLNVLKKCQIFKNI